VGWRVRDRKPKPLLRFSQLEGWLAGLGNAPDHIIIVAQLLLV
jgi:hypothetical protein